MSHPVEQVALACAPPFAPRVTKNCCDPKRVKYSELRIWYFSLVFGGPPGVTECDRSYGRVGLSHWNAGASGVPGIRQLFTLFPNVLFRISLLLILLVVKLIGFMVDISAGVAASKLQCGALGCGVSDGVGSQPFGNGSEYAQQWDRMTGILWQFTPIIFIRIYIC